MKQGKVPNVSQVTKICWFTAAIPVTTSIEPVCEVSMGNWYNSSSDLREVSSISSSSLELSPS